MVSSVLSPPSMMKFTLRPMPPLRAMVSWPGFVGSGFTARVVPGARMPRFANCRPLRGRFASSSWLTTVPTAGEVATSGISAVTVTCSLTAASFNVRSRVRVVATFTTTSSTTSGAKPESSAFTE